ncbi:1-(5-phosphoribosyl)-5-[(5-phosphoribosylamino)methylideneamino]imidazole-4-carboxamide isomerase [Candidatus Tachikawaea gelatinosa]|uniref:1-(5-phosphoribosyl)-5-[(5-phosphoribosylamino)methylideneamino] imidazole-4-carboxamide isomerase n=1 Tax=Candidatus Tachikawaea gelatinosa TaxID=1410383 RepID=A0A090AJS1_9ENTR|nr:1-(5-phosphoribosyl)-5-[(5-phosphoribosylamino)methylideneamino]imidazole-4-carboxamide isomerase [Candidatus Tachikawaea gelatinosa]BAP58703.1 1-(5-phosphoribosyl)-5-[(5-phosphoribosylamino)methylideneamino] imidazole-4-carboxamide isomerase [Candidatus Tachikawaea gelatinosa]
MIIPALDLLDGKIVRLYQGDYKKPTYYQNHPFFYMNMYKEKGAKMIHLVDLNGANNSKNQLPLIKELIKSIKIPIQIGGGIRSIKDIYTLFKIGINRVVIGSSVIHNKKDVKIWINEFGADKIVFAIDIIVNASNKKLVAINGWKKLTQITLEEVISWFDVIKIKHMICTDILRDGTFLGPNIDLYKEILKKFPYIILQASGGVYSLRNVKDLCKSHINSVIIGRAFLENKFTYEEAIKCWQKESFHV